MCSVPLTEIKFGLLLLLLLHPLHVFILPVHRSPPTLSRIPELIQGTLHLTITFTNVLMKRRGLTSKRCRISSASQESAWKHPQTLMIDSRSGGSVAFKGSVLNYCSKLALCGEALVMFCTQGLLKEIIISRREGGSSLRRRRTLTEFLAWKEKVVCHIKRSSTCNRALLLLETGASPSAY